ncbi:MAG: DUF1343 domain-containing protein [Acidobacteriota bacterium]|jgi:uncharacterized protein YbbC (DUF1343 family)|nr:DUF1343 domain-containing protein [Acidobacteriota bacterium]
MNTQLVKSRIAIMTMVGIALSLALPPPPSAAENGATMPQETRPRVLNGIDVLRAQDFAPLAGKRVGLITNHTGRAVDGASTIDLLFQAEACTLVALFSPEHGIRGVADERVDSSIDAATGLPVHSLYGKTRRPTPEMLRGIDALVFDIQDVGARFYTYITTMAYAMESAARAGIPFYVLDRPNPIGGVKVEGPMLDADKASFTGYMPLPVRHGMTVGELARYFNAEKKLGARLEVIPMNGWRRAQMFWDTGQTWVNPSPNMRSVTAAILYPGVCLLEATNVSVGRGTDAPFEFVGAPWIEPGRFAAQLTARLREAGVGGVAVVPVQFTPTASKHKGALCGGVNLIPTDPEKLDSVALGLEMGATLHRLYPKTFEVDGVLSLLGNAAAMRTLKGGATPKAADWEKNLDFLHFIAARRKVLIYNS